MDKILEKSWDILKNNPKLYNTPILIFIITLLINPFGLGSSFSGTLSFVGLTLINLALHTGWINQIFTTILDKDKKVSFEDVLIGIGKYFSKVLNIAILLIIVLMITMGIYSSIIEKNINMNEKGLNNILNSFKNLKDINQESILSVFNSIPKETLKDLLYLANSFLIYGTIIFTVYFFISLWNYILIYKNNPSYKSLISSFKLISKKIFSFTFLSFIDFIITTAIILSIFYSNNEFLSILFLALKIVTQTFFTISFCVFIDKNSKFL